MRSKVQEVLIGLSLVMSTGVLAPLHAAPGKPAATIVSPKSGSKVERIVEISGMVPKGLMPVVLVRALEPEETWWVQPEIEFDREGRFRGRIHCGNDKSLHGTKFEVVVIALSDARAYAEIQRGSSLRELPAQIPQSRVVLVVLHRSP